MPVEITDAALGIGTLIIPIVGSLIIGLMARFGSDKIRGHGLLSTTLYRIEDLFHRFPSIGCGGRLGAVVVGLGGLIDAHVLGAGYANIQALLDGSLAMRVVIVLLVVKAVVWLVALGSGTSGGVLAPLLILGGAAGYLIGLFLPDGTPGFWAMMGMAGIMSGAMRAPITGRCLPLNSPHISKHCHSPLPHRAPAMR